MFSVGMCEGQKQSTKTMEEIRKFARKNGFAAVGGDIEHRTSEVLAAGQTFQPCPIAHSHVTV